jgi:polar amino acid transport system substrate-binding protein
MKIKSTLLALLTGAALVVGACGASASPSPSAAAGTICEKAIAAGEAETTLLGFVCKQGEVRISTDPNYPPFSSLNATTNEYEGFDIDVAKLIAEKLGVTIKWETPSWDALTAGNWADRWDVSVGSMAQTEARAKVIDFSEPYYYALAYVAVPSTSTAMSLADLAGKEFCIGSGTLYESWLNGEFANQNLVEVSAQPPAGITVTSEETDNLCIEKLAAGRTWDGFVQGKEFIDNAIAGGAAIKYLDNKWLTAEKISVALDKGGKDTASMLAAINEIIAAAHADGTLTALSKKDLNGVDVTVKQ